MVEPTKKGKICLYIYIYSKNGAKWAVIMNEVPFGIERKLYKIANKHAHHLLYGTSNEHSREIWILSLVRFVSLNWAEKRKSSS